MSASLITAREFLERAFSVARCRADERMLGERICAIAELQELDELRVLAEVALLGCKHSALARHRRAETLGGCAVVAGDCLECGALVRTTMPRDWDGTVYVWSTSTARPRRVVI